MQVAIATATEVAPATDWIAISLWNVVARISLWIDQVTNQRINLGRLKAGDFDVQVAFREQIGEFTQFRSKNGTIPTRV
jgi:hypothetical protein